MKPKTKALIYNFLGFAPIFFVSYMLLIVFTELERPWPAIISAVVTFVLAPKFQVVNSHGKDRLFMKWIFRKGVKELS